MDCAKRPTFASHYSGGHLPSNQVSELEAPYTGSIGERVYIHLTKPRTCGITIRETTVRPERGVLDITELLCYEWVPPMLNIRNDHPVIGTTRKNKVRIYTRQHPYFNSPERPSPYSGVGFERRVNIHTLKSRNLMDAMIYPHELVRQKYGYKCMDLKDVFNSESCSDPAVRVRCVVQQKRINGEFRFVNKSVEQEGKIERFEGLNASDSKTTDQTQDPFLERIRVSLPVELYINIWQYMNYDQVKFLADSDERFARCLANQRYKLDSYDLDKYPDMSAIMVGIRKENAREIRISPKEDLWIASLSSGGVAKRFATAPGVYSWHNASAITGMRFNCNRTYCKFCLTMFTKLQDCMAESQEKAVQGKHNISVLALEGGEEEALDHRFTSVFYEKSSPVCDSDFAVHMWLDDLEHRWLQDITLDDKERLTVDEFMLFKKSGTLIFKNPVKFFGTLKVIDEIDDDIIALTSKLDNEVLGYLVANEEWRLRVPSTTKAEPKIIGLNLLPDTLVCEYTAAQELIKHVRQHELERAREHVEERGPPLNLDSGLTLKESIIEKVEDEIHTHEIYEDDVDFCTIYKFNKLGESTKKEAIKRRAELMFTRCPYERENPKNICTLKVINRQRLCSAYAIETGEKLNIDLE